MTTAPASWRATVMVVDDEPDVLLSVTQILDANNYRTIGARDGYECLMKLRERGDVPDVLLLDIMMPGLSTKDLLNYIESDNRLSNMKIIFLTAIHSQEAEEIGLLNSRQVVDFIEKPFTVRRMLEAVEKAIGKESDSESE